MAQLLVHIDPDLKRKLKAKLAEEGKTFKTWVEQMARTYIEASSVLPPPTPTVHPQTGFATSDYNVEED